MSDRGVCEDCGRAFTVWYDEDGDPVDDVCPGCDRDRVEGDKWIRDNFGDN